MVLPFLGSSLWDQCGILHQWNLLNIKMVFPGMWISIIKIRRSRPSYLYNGNSYTSKKACFNIKTISLNMPIMKIRPLYVYNGNSYTGKMTYSNWKGPLELKRPLCAEKAPWCYIMFIRPHWLMFWLVIYFLTSQYPSQCWPLSKSKHFHSRKCLKFTNVCKILYKLSFCPGASLKKDFPSTVITCESWNLNGMCSVHRWQRTHQTFQIARPKCLRDFMNLNRIYKAYQTNVSWTMKVFSTVNFWIMQ